MLGEEFNDLDTAEQGAFRLSQAAVMLDQARDDGAIFAAALDNNMELWIAIRVLAAQGGANLSDEIKRNLIKLSDFVANTTLRQGVEMPSEVLDTLININLQISEGLLEGRPKT